MTTNSPQRFLCIILLVISASFLLGGVSLACLLRMEWAYQHQDERLSEKGSGQLRLSRKEYLASLHRPDELIFQGRMFDIREVQESGSEVVVLGHFDDEESFLLDWLQGKSRSDQKVLSSLVFFFQYKSCLNALSFRLPSAEFVFPEHDREAVFQHVLRLLRPPAIMV